MHCDAFLNVVPTQNIRNHRVVAEHEMQQYHKLFEF